LAGAQYVAADDPVQGSGGVQRAIAARPAPGEEIVLAPEGADPRAAQGGGAVEDAPQVPIVKDSAFDRAGRNDPCPCGSGKKFKFCHGR
jgi:hypothetical protein